MASISKKFAAIVAALWSAMRSLFDVFLGDKKGKEKEMAAGVVVFRGGTWLLVFATFAAVAFLRKIGFSYFQIFVLFWVGNLIICGAVIRVNAATKIDFTSMEGSRNLLRRAQEKSKFLGYLAEIWLFFWLIFYSGPDQFFIFFEERFSSKEVKVLVFVLITLCYSAFWSVSFALGADGLLDLISKLY